MQRNTWNLPPGVSLQMIDSYYGYDQPDAEEPDPDFESLCQTEPAPGGPDDAA